MGVKQTKCAAKKRISIQAGEDLRYFSVVIKVLIKFSACFGRATVGHGLINVVAKRRWICRSENVPRNGVVVSSGFMIAPFPSDSIE